MAHFTGSSYSIGGGYKTASSKPAPYYPPPSSHAADNNDTESKCGQNALIIHGIITAIATLSLVILTCIYADMRMSGELYSQVSLGFAASVLLSGIVAIASDPKENKWIAAIPMIVMLVFAILFGCAVGNCLAHEIPAITIWVLIGVVVLGSSCVTCLSRFCR